MGWTLAIDFGTSFTTAAMLAGGRAELLEIDNSRYLPSMVFVEDDGQFAVGAYAVGRAEVFPERTERCPKRALVGGGRVRLGGHDLLASELVAAILRRVYDEAVRRQGADRLDTLVLTHPARWGTYEIGLLGQAAAKAGLAAPRYVPEPVAAATHYASSARIAPGQYVAVYDLGGGTFDTAVLRRTREGFDLAGPPGGHDRLGGEDFDAALLGLVGDHAADIDGDAWDALMSGEGRAQARGRGRLRTDITRAKHSLSERLSTSVLPDGYDDEIRVTRAEFEQRIDKPLRDSLDELLATIARAGLKPGDLAAIHLTGGSSRIPRISDLLAETLGALPLMEGDPKGVVALGALRTLVPPVPTSAAPAAPAVGPTQQPPRVSPSPASAARAAPAVGAVQQPPRVPDPVPDRTSRQVALLYVLLSVAAAVGLVLWGGV